jgi:hypothetical protein
MLAHSSWEPAYLGAAHQRLASEVVFTIGCYQLLRHKPAPSPVQEETGTYRSMLRRHATLGIANTSPFAGSRDSQFRAEELQSGRVE